MQQRIELEADAPEAVPDLEWVRQSGLVEFARTDDALPTLGIAFTTDFVRKATVVEPVPDTRIEICLDQGSIVAGQRREPICEVELELKQGELAPLFDLARQIVAVPGVRVESASKAQRGYRLAARERTATVRARTPRLPAGADIDTVFKTLAFECMAQLQGNEHGVLHSRDIEYLHQARVALRRLRSVFNVFSEVIPEKHFADQLEWLHDTSRLLGRARDWDVFVTGFLPLACKRLGDETMLAEVTRTAARLRALARRQVRAALTNPDYSVQMICLTQKLHEQNWEADRSVEQRMLASQPANAFASSVLERAHRRVFRQAKRMDRSSAADIHKLRIRIKRLRYCSELLSPLFKRKAARKFLKRLAGMQDMLGAHNDAVSAANLIDQLRQANDTPEYVEVLAYLRGYAHAQSRFSLSGFGAKWNKLDSAAVFW